MKKAFILFTICLAINAFGQKVFSNEKDLFNSRKITFYGYDFSNFQLSDAKRVNQDLKKYLFTLSGFLDEHLPSKKLEKWIDKDSIIYNYSPTIVVNKGINSEAISAFAKHTINKDSIQSFVNRYQIVEKEGIGYVIIFECFDNASKSVSAYQVFFDVNTKKIITIDYNVSKDGNSYNRISDWNAAAFLALKRLADIYKDKQDKYLKGKK